MCSSWCMISFYCVVMLNYIIKRFLFIFHILIILYQIHISERLFVLLFFIQILLWDNPVTLSTTCEHLSFCGACHRSTVTALANVFRGLLPGGVC